MLFNSSIYKSNMGKTPMSRRLQLVVIVCTVASIVAIISHGLIAWLKIETTFGEYWVTGPGRGKPSIFMAGSSLAGDGLAWGRIGNELNMRIEGWGVAGSSPCEWEQFQHLTTQIKLTFIVVSPYDLNEYYLSDFRAEVVPLGQTIKDLWHKRAEWPYCKRLLSLYPLTYLRILFPTAGRSDGVMVGVREKLKKLVGAASPMNSEAGPTLSLNETASTQEYKEEKISNWDPSRMLRRLAGLRIAGQGVHLFNGPKRLAFLRMLRQAQEVGRIVVVVLPVSPAYAKEFLTPELKGEFEQVLAETRRSVPQTGWIRLDQLKELNSNEYFWDLVHMNPDGQKIATKAFLTQFRKFSNLP